MSSEFFTILEAVESQIQDLGLTFNEVAVPVVIKKIPKAEQGLDTLPVIMVTPSTTNVDVKRANFEGNQFVTYPILVAIIGSGNTDFYSNLDTYNQWLESIRNLFETTGVEATGVYRTDVKPLDIFNRRLLSINYDFLALELRVGVFQ